jgi:hypothetical protein
MLLICYMFSIAFSISARENKMISKLEQYKDNTFDYSLGSGDIVLLTAIGSIIALFAGGMTATLLSHRDSASPHKWLLPCAIVAITTILVIDGYMLITWNDSMQKWHQNPLDEFGRPFEPIDPFMLIFLMIAVDWACFVAAASGGAVAWISKDTYRS